MTEYRKCIRLCDLEKQKMENILPTDWKNIYIVIRLLKRDHPQADMTSLLIHLHPEHHQYGPILENYAQNVTYKTLHTRLLSCAKLYDVPFFRENIGHTMIKEYKNRFEVMRMDLEKKAR